MRISVLVISLIIAPLTFFVYTSLSDARMWCHIPSWVGVNIAFEVFPYILVGIMSCWVLIVGYFLLRYTQSIFENALILLVCYTFYVLSFSLVYYSFGLEQYVRESAQVSDGFWSAAFDPIQYVRFSISQMLPGLSVQSLRSCQSADNFIILQNYVGIGLTFISAIFVARFVGRRTETTTETDSECEQLSRHDPEPLPRLKTRRPQRKVFRKTSKRWK